MNNYYNTKYDSCNDFDEMLGMSQDLVIKIKEYLLLKDFMVRSFDDSMPFNFYSGEQIRGLDIFAAKNGKSYFIDAKDYARLLFYDATGIPIYLYKRYKYIQDITGIKTIIFFIDNSEYENEKTSKNLKIDSKFKTGNIFIPYGGEMDSFIKHKKQNIPNQKGYPQIIWECDSMKKITEIF